ncbi:hypothetical protein PENSPDRAFT_759943 [Peniophora sp. CONT]|nr:hypothetical protein PENSPDRAFT_759943 [Peniophora sp. CONT]
MSSPSLNFTEQDLVLNSLYEYTASSLAPSLLLESFMMGVLCACVPLVSYLLWAKPHSFPRAPFIFTVWIILSMAVTHWALSMRQLEYTLTGGPVEIPMNGQELNVGNIWADVWLALLPLVTETVLFGMCLLLQRHLRDATVARDTITELK